MDKAHESFWLRTWVAWRIGSLQKWIPKTLEYAEVPFPDFLQSKIVTTKNMEVFFKFFTPGESEFLIYESRGEFYLTNIRLVLLKIEQSSRIYKSINVQDILKLDATSGAFSITIIVKTKKDETYVFKGLNGSYDIDFRYWNVIIRYAQSENAWQDVREKLISSSSDETVKNSIILNTAPVAKDVGTKNNNGAIGIIAAIFFLIVFLRHKDILNLDSKSIGILVIGLGGAIAYGMSMHNKGKN